MTTREQRRGDWMARVREAARSEAENPRTDEWHDHDRMHGLAEAACELRALAGDGEWKVPFNRFRHLFVHRQREALQHFAEGTGDDAFWLAAMHYAFEPEA